MTATKVGIVYSIAQRRRRWVLVPDDDSELPVRTLPGEGYLEQAMADFQQRGPDAALQDHLGAPPLSDRCAIIDRTHTVQDHCCADPGIDTLPSHTLVQSDISAPGDTYVPASATFSRRYVQVNAAGIVTGIISANPATPPVASNPGGSVRASLTSQVGQAATP